MKSEKSFFIPIFFLEGLLKDHELKRSKVLKIQKD